MQPHLHISSTALRVSFSLSKPTIKPDLTFCEPKISLAIFRQYKNKCKILTLKDNQAIYLENRNNYLSLFYIFLDNILHRFHCYIIQDLLKVHLHQFF